MVEELLEREGYLMTIGSGGDIAARIAKKRQRSGWKGSKTGEYAVGLAENAEAISEGS